MLLRWTSSKRQIIDGYSVCMHAATCDHVVLVFIQATRKKQEQDLNPTWEAKKDFVLQKIVLFKLTKKDKIFHMFKMIKETYL